MSTCRRLSLVLTLVFMAAACDSNQQSLSMSAQLLSRMDETKAHRGQHFRQMVDNAVLSDPSVADIHFMPHSAEISGIGELRLNRLAPILNTYGGTVHYATVLADTVLVAKRIDRVNEYLSLAGCNMARVEVVVGRPSGRGMLAEEAVEQLKQGTKPESGSSSGGSTLGQVSLGQGTGS